MADRYFSESPILGQHATLEDAEAHHLLHVMRAKPGDEVVLFDGSGAEFAARVLRIQRSTVELEVLSRSEPDRERPRPLCAGVALPKGDRQKWLVEKLTELGVGRLVPLETQRGVAQPNPGALQRLRRSVIEASKQCGRNCLMSIEAPQSLPEFLASQSAANLRWFAHPGGLSLAAEIDRARRAGNSPTIAFAIGPEGGFTASETAAAQTATWHPLDLGPRILRIETAALTLAALATTL